MNNGPRTTDQGRNLGATLGLAATAGGLAGIFHLLGRQPHLSQRVPEFIALALAAGVLYLIGVFLVCRYALGLSGLLVVLAGAMAFRFFLLAAPPSLSEDVYRYQWEGRVQRGRLNPYTIYPAMPGLGRFADPKHPFVTGAATPTAYPPLSEKAFSWVRTIRGYKQLFAALDLASLVILLALLRLREQPLARSLIYAWNPTILVSFAMCAHHDSLAIATLLVALFFIIGNRPAVSIAWLGLSFLSKFFPGLLLPVFLRRAGWGYLAIFAGVVVLGYIPFLDAGWSLLAGLGQYWAGWEGNDSLFRLVLLAGNSKAQAQLVVGVLLVALAAYAVKQRLEPLAAGLVLTAGLLLLSPNAFPWYFTWTVPFLCFYPSAPWLLMTVTCALGYAPVVAYAAGQPYQNLPWVLALEYAPVYLWLAYAGWRALRFQKK